MMHIPHELPASITKLSDGTIKQRNPFSGTEVWTVPGRANRPLKINTPPAFPIDPDNVEDVCAFCPQRVLETPPEKSRIVGNPTNGNYTITDNAPVDALADTWNFRRVSNLFEIVPLAYWQANYGYVMPTRKNDAMERYIADPAGRAHVLGVAQGKALASGISEEKWAAISEHEKIKSCATFFGGGHDLILGRRHYSSEATTTTDLAGSGTLTPNEHFWYFALTAHAMEDLYLQNRYVTYVQVFQNWLKPAGASFDHLHKQLVSIDERTVNNRYETEQLRRNPNLFNEYGVDYASKNNLIIAENPYAVAYAGFGHRYPTLEVWSKSAANQPFQHSEKELRGVSDLVHAMHVATGVHVPCNEEWYAGARGMDMASPWRVLIKWRVSTLAGFEGGTKIYVNTIDPWSLRDRIVPKLLELRAEGKIASMNIATECACELNSLRYLQREY